MSKYDPLLDFFYSKSRFDITIKCIFRCGRLWSLLLCVDQARQTSGIRKSAYVAKHYSSGIVISESLKLKRQNYPIQGAVVVRTQLPYFGSKDSCTASVLAPEIQSHTLYLLTAGLRQCGVSQQWVQVMQALALRQEQL